MKRLALACLLALAASAAQAQVKSGTYVAEGGGRLTVKDGKFSILTRGGDGSSCDVRGALKGLDGLATRYGDCAVRFTVTKDGVEVEAKTPDDCRAYCGPRALFEGSYRTTRKGGR